MAATLELLGEGGLAAASTTAIAARVGLTQSGLFKHFTGKEEILRAAMDAIGARVGERVAEAVARPATPLSRARAVVEAYLDVAAETPALQALLFSGEARSGGAAGFLRCEIQDRFERLRALLELVVRNGIGSGRAAASVDAEAAALLLVGVAQAVLLRRHLADGAFDHRRELDRMWAMIEAALFRR